MNYLKLYCGAVTRMDLLADGEVSVKVMPIILWSPSLKDARLEALNEGLRVFGPDQTIRTHLIKVPKNIVFYNELSEERFTDLMDYPEREA